MIRLWQLILADALLTLLSITVGLMLRLEIVYVGYFLEEIWPYILFAVLLRPIVFYLTGVYKRIWRYATTKDYLHFVLALFAGSIIIAAGTLVWLFPRWMLTFPRSLLAIETILSLIFLGGLRISLKLFEHFPGDVDWKSVNLPVPKRTLIVGAGAAGAQMLKEFLENPHLGYYPVALLDDDPEKIDRKVAGLRVYGPLVRLSEVVLQHNIEAVIIAMPSAPSQTVESLQGVCQHLDVGCAKMPSLSSFLDERTPDGGSAFRVPMAMPDITGQEIQAVVRVIQSRNLSIGSQVRALEHLAAEQAGVKFAVSASNGTSALHMCIIAADIGPGDEVITTPFSFVASANCILYQHATPVFADIDSQTLNISPERIEAAITERTKAIIPVHVFGQPAEMDAILDIAERHNLLVIEDAAEAIGAEYRGRKAGTIGKAGVFAFYPNKQMTTGEGAVLVTNDEEWAWLFRSLRNQGRDQFDEWLNHSRLGYNYRMSELNAAVGVVQVQRLDDLLKRRNEVAKRYNAIIAKIDGVSPLTIAPTTTRMSWFVYPARFDEDINRNIVMQKLAEMGIPARPYFSPIHLQPFYQKQFNFAVGDFPAAEAAGNSILALPFYTNMNTDEIEIVCSALQEAIKDARR